MEYGSLLCASVRSLPGFLARTHDGQFGHTWIDEQIPQALHLMANPIMVILNYWNSTDSKWSPEQISNYCYVNET